MVMVISCIRQLLVRTRNDETISVASVVQPTLPQLHVLRVLHLHWHHRLVLLAANM